MDQLLICLDNSLIGNVLELIRSVDKFLPNLVGKLDRRNEVADTEAKAHRGLERNAVIVAQEGKLARRSRHRNGDHVRCLEPPGVVVVGCSG
jgi:hypothetical protein